MNTLLGSRQNNIFHIVCGAASLGMVCKSPSTAIPTPPTVMPAKAGIQSSTVLADVFKSWIPACARMTNFYRLSLGLALGLILVAGTVRAQPAPLAAAPDATVKKSEVQQGSLLLKTDRPGAYVAAPALQTDVHMQVSGMTARVKVLQKFHNPSKQWVEGVYVFPLPENAAVDHMRMRIGERIIEGQVQEKLAARATYEAAKQSGKQASLVEQERPNLFSTSVANLGPEQDISIEIEYQQTLRYDQGAYRLRFPMAVTPRYIPGTQVVEGATGTGLSENTNQVPDAARITPPVQLPTATIHNPVKLEIDMDAGFPLAQLNSSYHPVTVQALRGHRYHIELKAGAVASNKDFELMWVPNPGSEPRAAVFTEPGNGQHYALMMLMPPQVAALGKNRLARETVFIIDTSGSMQGESLKQAKQALLLALERLQPSDRFNVIQFNSVTHELFQAPVPGDAEHVERAKDYVRALRADGGTEMLPALTAALKSSAADERVRQVIFLTDGAVGNEDELFKLIHTRLGDRRLFTVGIGSAPNSHFMSKAAEFGRGTFTYIGNVAEVGEKMSALFSKLDSPVLTHIKVEFPAGGLVEMRPQKPPDLYAGEPVVFTTALKGLKGVVKVSGMRGATPWEMTLPLANSTPAPGVHVLWARSKIQSLLDSVQDGADAEAVRKQVVAVALGHHLVSKHTSLVAVDVTRVRPEHEALNENLALATNYPEGWAQASMSGKLPNTATPAQFQLLLGMLALLLASLIWASARRAVRHA